MSSLADTDHGTVKRREWALSMIEGQTIPVPDLWPKAMRDLVDDLRANGWPFRVDHGEDTGGSPYLTVNARHRESERGVRATWHTRGTGTYRLFSAMLFRPYRGWRDLAVKALRAEIAAPAVTR